MADSPHHDQTEGAKRPGYETSDVSPALIVKWGIGLTVMVIVSFLLMRWLFVADVKAINKQRPPVSPLTDVYPVPPAPLLRANPTMDLVRLRQMEAGLLTRYEWVQEDARILRIPVERALALVAERGLPAWPTIQLAPPAADATNAPVVVAVPAAPETAAPAFAEPAALPGGTP